MALSKPPKVPDPEDRGTMTAARRLKCESVPCVNVSLSSPA